MAYYAALAPLLQLLDDIILHRRYPSFRLCNHPLLKSLHQKFTFLEDSLEGYSSTGSQVNDRVEARIRDVAYQARDIVEFQISKQLCSEQRRIINQKLCSEERSRIKKCSPLSCFRSIQRERCTVKELKWLEQEADSAVEELKMVEREADSVAEEMMAIKERQKSEGKKLLNWDSPTISTLAQPPTTENIVDGDDDDLNIIKDHLCGHSSQLQVIPIVGMGGIGKTTLARNIFDDALVRQHFDRRIWITVSQNYHLKMLLEGILGSLNLLTDELCRAEEVEQKLKIYQSLMGRRYLIVVDDVWSTQFWDDVKTLFPKDDSGSRIMLTTRILDVARYVSTPDFLHEMRFLDNDQSWNLLRRKVFAEECCPPELETIGMSIAMKCFGLPLAIIVMAGILSKAKTWHDWEKIAADMGTTWSRNDEYVSSILSLSYNHLPHHLKACFLYMGSFPEDEEINISNLVRLWIAEGFVKSSDGSNILEKVAEEYVEDLVQRNLILITRKRSNGQFKCCNLHDVLRDFCRQRAFHENFFHVEDMEGYFHPRGIDKIRHVNFDLSSPCSHPPCRGFACGRHHRCNIGKLVRTIHLFSKANQFQFSSFEWDELKLLRVFNSFGLRSNYWSLPDGIFQMCHLKYFSSWLIDYHSIFYTRDKFSSIYQLRNLQTLVFHPAKGVINLTLEVCYMSQLRHLIIGEVTLLSGPICSEIPLPTLLCLQTLQTIRDFRFTIEAVEMIPNLRKLKALQCEGFNNLVHLPHLEELAIINAKSANFAFPLNLKKLSLTNCHIPWKDMTMVGSLPNLQVLKLGPSSFVGEEWEPNEGEFRCLKFLQLWTFDLKYWRAENTHFPRLEYLEIKYCTKLEMIPLDIGDIPTLKVINVLIDPHFKETPQNKRLVESAMKIQEEQRDMGNELRVRIHMYGDEKEKYMELSAPARYPPIDGGGNEYT